MASSGAVRYRRTMIRAVTPAGIAEQLAELRRAAVAFGVEAVAEPLEQAAQEALSVARTENEAELARQLLVAARTARFRRAVRR
jgi:hypothetical protein